MKSTRTLYLQQSVSPAMHRLRTVFSGDGYKTIRCLPGGIVRSLAPRRFAARSRVTFRLPVTAHGASLYSPATEVTVKGNVEKVLDFTCPVSDGEMGTHLLLKTADGTFQVHLAPGRIRRSQKLSFAPGDQLTVIGLKIRALGTRDLVARKMIRGPDDFIFRDHAGNLLLVQ